MPKSLIVQRTGETATELRLPTEAAEIAPPPREVVTQDLEQMSIKQLVDVAREWNVPGAQSTRVQKARILKLLRAFEAPGLTAASDRQRAAGRLLAEVA